MPTFEDLSFCFESFSGTARLLPLPNLVLFPHVMQPLHIFERRYRRLIEDALETDRLVAVATLAPGWEDDYEGRPPMYPVACLGRITAYHRLEDGAYNVLLLGLRRIRLLRELEPSDGFREAEVELCEDYSPPQQHVARGTLRRRLRQAFLKVVPLFPDVQEQLDYLFDTDVSLGVLTDVVSYALDLDLHDKEVLLAQLDVQRRAELLLEHLAAAAECCCGQACEIAFPPQFSAN